MCGKPAMMGGAGREFYGGYRGRQQRRLRPLWRSCCGRDKKSAGIGVGQRKTGNEILVREWTAKNGLRSGGRMNLGG